MKNENVWIRFITFILICVMMIQLCPVYAIEDESVVVETESADVLEEAVPESSEEDMQGETNKETQTEEEIEEPSLFEDENGNQWIGVGIPAESVPEEVLEENIGDNVEVYDAIPIQNESSVFNKRGIKAGATYRLWVMVSNLEVSFDTPTVTLSYNQFDNGNRLTGTTTYWGTGTAAGGSLGPKYVVETIPNGDTTITNYYVAYCMTPDASAVGDISYGDDTVRWGNLYECQKTAISLAVAYGFQGLGYNWYVAAEKSSAENNKTNAPVSAVPRQLFGADADTYYKSAEQFLATQLIIWEIICGYRDCREEAANRFAFSTHNSEPDFGKGSEYYFPNYPTVYTAYNMIDRLLYLHTKRPSYSSRTEAAANAALINNPDIYTASLTIANGVPGWRFALPDTLAISDAFEVGVPDDSPLAPYLKNGGIKWSVSGDKKTLWVTVYDFSAAALMMSDGCIFTTRNKYMKKVEGGADAVIALSPTGGAGYQPICTVPPDDISPDPTAYYFKLKALASSTSIIRKVSNSGGNVGGITFKFRNETKGANIEFTTDSYGNATGDISSISSFNQVAMYHFVEKITSGMEPIESVELIIRNGDTEKQHIIINKEFYKYSSNGGAFTTVAVDHTVTTNGNIKYYFGSGDTSPVFGVQNDGSTQGFWNVTLNLSDNDTITVIATNGTSGNLDIIKKVNGSTSTSANGWTFNVFKTKPSPTYWHQEINATGAKSYTVSSFTNGLATGSPVIEVYVGDVVWPKSGDNYYTFTRSSSSKGTIRFYGSVVPQQGDVITIVYKTYDGRNNSPDYTGTTQAIDGVNGKISIPNLVSGTYYVEEVPQSGYKWVGSMQSVSVSAGSTASVTFNNIPLNGFEFQIQKTIASGKSGQVNGWQFYAQTRSASVRYYSTSITSTGASSYTVSPSSSYPFGTNPLVEVYVNDSLWPTSGNSYYTFTRNSTTKGTLKFVGDIVPLNGDTITVVYRTNRTGGTDLGTTDTNGLLNPSNIATGTYYIEEVPQEGYKYCEPKSVTINTGGIIALPFENTPLSTRLLIKKTIAEGSTGNVSGWQFVVYNESVRNTLISQGGTAYGIATYTATENGVNIIDFGDLNIQNSSALVSEVYKNGTLLDLGDDYIEQSGIIEFAQALNAGDVVNVVYRNPAASSLRVYTTDANGYISISDLTAGTYYVEELPVVGYAVTGTNPKSVTVSNYSTSNVVFENKNDVSIEIQKEFAEGITGSLSGWRFVTYSTALDHPLVYMNSFPCDQYGFWQDVGNENQGYFNYAVYDILAVYINGVPGTFTSQGDGELTLTSEFSEGDEITVVYTTAPISYEILGPTDGTGKITKIVSPGTYYVEEIPQYGYEIPAKQTASVSTTGASLTFTNTKKANLDIQKKLAAGVTGDIAGLKFAIYPEASYAGAADGGKAFEMASHIYTAKDQQNQFVNIDELGYEIANNTGIVDVYCNGICMEDGVDYQIDEDNMVLYIEDMSAGDLLQIVYKHPHAKNIPVYTTNNQGQINMPDMIPGVYYVEELPNPAYAPQPSQKVTLVNGQTAYVEFVNTIPTVEIQKEFVSGTTGSLEGWEFVMYSGNLNRPLVYMNSFPCDEGGCWDDVEGEHQGFFDYLVYDILQVYVNGEPTTFYTYGESGLELTGEYAVNDEITVVYTTAPINYEVLGPTDEAGLITQSVNPGLYHIEEIPQYGYEIPEKQTVIITEGTSLVFENRSPTGLTIQKILANGVTGSVSGIEFFVCDRDYYDNVISTDRAFGMISHIVTADEVGYGYFDLFDIGVAEDEYVTVYSIYRNNELVDRGDYSVDCEFVEFSGLFEEGDLVQFVYKKSPVDNSHVYTTEEDGRILIEGLTAGEYYIEELPIPQYVTQTSIWTIVRQGENAEVMFRNSKPSLDIVKSFAPGTNGLPRGWKFVLYTEKVDQPLVYMNTFPCNAEGYWQSVGYDNQEYFDYDVYDILAVYINGEPVAFDSQADELNLMEDFVEGDAITVVYTTMDIDYTITASTNARGRITVRNLNNGIYYVEEIPQFGYKIPSKQRIIVSGQESSTLDFVNATEEYLGSIQIEKVDIQDNPLEGAHFILQYREVGEDVWETAVFTDDNSAMEVGCFYTDQEVNEDNSITTDVDGIAKFSQLKANGTIEYQLVEVQAPAGCDLMQSPVYVGVLPAQFTFDDKEGLVTWREAYQHDAGDYIVQSTTVRQYNVYYCVVNNAIILPTPTGGNGLFMVTLGSMGMAITAFAIVATRKKRKFRSSV